MQKPVAKSTGQPSEPTRESSFLDDVDRLLTGVGRLRSDRPILTRRDNEWLNDSQIANDNALVVQPTQALVKFKYPRPEDGLAALLTGRSMSKLLATPGCAATVVMPYSVNQLHWHELFVSFSEAVIYHFEAFGEPLERRGTVLATFRENFEPKGWQLISLRQKYQADSSSCGVWLQVARDAWLRYLDSDAFGTASFESFLEGELAAEGVRDLYKCRGATKTAAARKSREFILGQRADMRGRLVQAALAGKLKYEAASLSGFASSIAQDLDLEEYDDEELE